MYLTLQNPKTRIQNALKVGWAAILFIALWLGISLSVWAQPQYDFTAVSGTFTPITGGVDVNSIEADDAISAALPIGFTFTYNGTAYTQFRASSNGWMTFSTTATDLAGNGLSGASAARRPLLAPLWDDLDGRAPAPNASRATYSTTGTAPNRVFTMEWLNWEWNFIADNDVVSFQVKLYEATGIIEYIYSHGTNPVAGFSTSASIGLTTATGTGANTYLSLNNSSASPTVSSTTETININTRPAIGQIYRWSPKLFNLTPADNATAVALNSNLSMAFLSGTPVIGTGTIELRKTAGDALVESFTLPSPRVTLTGSTLTIDPTNILECNTEYYVTVPASAITGVPGFAGITTTTTWSFTSTAPVGTPANLVTLLDENFATATGSTPPTGWVNNRIAGATVDVWRFDNPGSRGATGFTAPFAIFDSDNICSGSVENVALESPAFDASTGLTYTLSFNHFFRVFLGNSYFVEVFNGTTWTTVFTGSSDEGSLTTPFNRSIDITTASGGNATAKVRFRWTGNCSWYWLVDDVKITSSTTELPLTATFTPLDNSTGVAQNSDLVLNFPYPVSAGTGNIEIFNVTTNTVIETIASNAANVDYSVTGQVTIDPTNPLPSGVNVAVRFATGAFQSCNNIDIVGITDNTTWNFTVICDLPTISAGADVTVPPSSVNLAGTATGNTAGYTYQWTPSAGLTGATTLTPTITSFSATQTYTLTATDANGNCIVTDQVTITNQCDALTINAGPDQPSVLSGSDVTLAGVAATGGSGVYSYAWSPSAGLNDATILTPQFVGMTTTTTFTLTVTDIATGCVKSDDVTVTIVVPTGGGGGSPSGLVRAPSLRLTSTGASSITLDWAGGIAQQYAIFRRESSSNSVRVAEVSSATETFLDTDLMPNTRYSYYVQAINGSNVANSNVASDYTYPLPPTIESFQNACIGTGALLNVKGSTGIYNVYSAETGGTAVATGDSTGVITTPSFTDPTTFYISAIGTRYESTPRVAVSVITRPLPTATLLGADLQESCTDSYTIMAEAVEGATYTWYSANSPVATTSVPMYTANRDGVYSVLVNKEGCVARSNSVRVRVNRISPATILGQTNQQFCEVGTLNAVQTEGASYEWQLNNAVVGTGSSLEVTQSGNYTVTVTSGLGCVLTSTPITVNIINVPQLDLQASASDFCEGTEGVELSVNSINGATYEWLRSGRRVRTTSTPSLQVNIGGEYRVRVILNGICSRTSDPVTVTRKAAPAASVRVYGDSIKVVYVGNVAISSVSWTKDDAPFSATTQAFAPTESGLYVATVTYETGCQVVASGITYIKPPEPPVVVGEENVEALGFMLFPNPTTNKVNLSFGDAFKGEITLTLTDAIGRTIQVVKVKATENTTLDLSKVANGNYMLTIASDDKVVTRKIIRE